MFSQKPYIYRERIIYSIQFTNFQKRSFVVIKTKFNKDIVYSLINRVEFALAQRGRGKKL